MNFFLLIICMMFIWLPVAHGVVYSFSYHVLVLYGLCSSAICFGFLCGRLVSFHVPFFLSRPNDVGLKASSVCLKIIFSVMTYAFVMSLLSISKEGGLYRMFYFENKAEIFGFDEFGTLFNIVCEYFAVVFFSQLMLERNFSKYKKYIYLWCLMGTVVTLGRWFILYTIILLFVPYFSKKGPTLNINMNLIFKSILVVMFIVAIFQFRGGEFVFETDVLFDSVINGVIAEIWIPLEMVAVYKDAVGYSFNLVLGFLIYPFFIISRATGVGHVEFEYDLWAVKIQEYVMLDNQGLYNAHVGQVLTSYVGGGYLGVAFTFSIVGLLLGVGYYRSNIPHLFSVIAFITLIFSYLVPAVSGSMFFYMFLSGLFLVFLQRVGILQK
jgi:hypothetical protein